MRLTRAVGVTFAVVALVVLSGCIEEDDDEGLPTRIEVETLDDGRVVRFDEATVAAAVARQDATTSVAVLDAEFGRHDWSSIEQLLDRSSRILVCVDRPRGYCVRAVDGEAVEESTDGGDSWKRVWRIDAESAATRRQVPFASLPQVSISIVDIAIAGDGSLVVSMTPLADPIVRWPNGSWSRDDKSFRLLPPAVGVQMIATALLTAVACLFASKADNETPDAARVRLPLVAVLTALVTLSLVHEAYNSDSWESELRFFSRAAGLALVLTVLAYRCRIQGQGPLRVWVRLAGVGVAVLVAFASTLPLRIWRASDMVSFTQAQRIGFGLALSLPLFAAGATRRLGRRVTLCVPLAAPPRPTPLSQWKGPAEPVLVAPLLFDFTLVVWAPIAAVGVGGIDLDVIGGSYVPFILRMALVVVVGMRMIARRRGRRLKPRVAVAAS